MSWNYRVWRQTHYWNGEEEVEFSIRETYYNVPNNDMTIWAVQQNPSPVTGDYPGNLIWNLDKMKEALDKPILDYDNFKFAEHD